MRRLRTITVTTLVIAVCIACFSGCRPNNDKKQTETTRSEAMEALRPATMIKIGNHTYYSDYVFEQRTIRANPEEYIIERLEEADKSLDEDIFIWAISISENEGATTAHASYIKHGMLLKHRGLSFDYKIDPKLGAEWHDYGQEDYDPSTDEEADRYWAKIYGAIFFNYPHYCLNRLEQENGVPSWEYLFTKDNGRLGSWHSGEMVYTFGVIPEKSGLYTEEDRKLSDTMHAYLVEFAKGGDPNSEALSGFEQSADSSRVMEFGVNVGMIEEPDLALYEIMDRMSGW